jgi:hypothetical protein
LTPPRVSASRSPRRSSHGASYLAAYGRPAHPRDLGAGRHECIHYLDPVTGRPFHWEFHRGRQKLRVAVSGRLTVNDVGTVLDASAAGPRFAARLAEIAGKPIELFKRVAGTGLKGNHARHYPSALDSPEGGTAHHAK